MTPAAIASRFAPADQPGAWLRSSAILKTAIENTALGPLDKRNASHRDQERNEGVRPAQASRRHHAAVQTQTADEERAQDYSSSTC